MFDLKKKEEKIIKVSENCYWYQLYRRNTKLYRYTYMPSNTLSPDIFQLFMKI